MSTTFNISFLFSYCVYIFYRFSTPQSDYVLVFSKNDNSYDLLPFQQFINFFKNGDYDC